MNIPFYIFLVIYLIVLAIVFVFAFFNLYHMFRFGFQDIQSRIITAIFIVALIILVCISAYFILQIDWTLELSIGFMR